MIFLITTPAEICGIPLGGFAILLLMTDVGQKVRFGTGATGPPVVKPRLISSRRRKVTELWILDRPDETQEGQ